jgi:hypothetical protein
MKQAKAKANQKQEVVQHDEETTITAVDEDEV